MKRKILLLFSLLFLVYMVFPNFFSADAFKHSDTIKWTTAKNGVRAINPSETNNLLNFEEAEYESSSNNLPIYHKRFSLSGYGNTVNNLSVIFTNTTFEPLNDEQLAAISRENISSQIEIKASIGYEKKIPIALVSFIPIRKNSITGLYEKLVRFEISITPTNFFAKKNDPLKTYAQKSVLKDGAWFKIGVVKDGIYRITCKDLIKLGIDSSINPKNIAIYGNGGGMLPLPNSAFRYDDLTENAIFVSGESNDVLDSTDYILFYGQGQHRWQYNSSDQRYHHLTNIYSDTTYYFITTEKGPGKRKRILQQNNGSAPNITVTSFDDYAYHELDKVNLLKSGKEWYGEAFDQVTTQEIQMPSMPNIDTSTPVYLRSDVIARALTSINNNFLVKVNGQSVLTENIPAIPDYYWGNTAMPCNQCTVTFPASSPDFKIGLTYTKPTTTSSGWLNYLELNARRQMIMTGNQFLFRDIKSVGVGNMAEFVLSNASSTIQLWEVTDPVNVKMQTCTYTANEIHFNQGTDSLREFIAFSNSGYLSPEFYGKIQNQDLHGLPQSDMIIISPGSLIDEAKRLGKFHQDHDTMSVIIVTPQQICNEFSSGALDVAAIRDFVKMFYNRSVSSSDMPKYLLLFGDGSYDNKDRIVVGANLIPTYQSVNSLVPTESYVSDDFFGLLDSSEGQWDAGDPDLQDIAIGRLPVRTNDQAKAMVDKIIRYATPGTFNNNVCSNTASTSFGDWRNVVCFIADDEDGGVHLNQADELASRIDTADEAYNIDKIYFDSFKQESTPGGQRYPEAEEAINKRMEKGALIMNYTGHGGEVGLAHERVVSISNINSWKNINNLPLFFTATCEFSRFDDPELTSAGELVLLNPDGGGIALMSTVRLVYSNPNFTLNTRFYDNIFTPVNGIVPPIGEVFRKTKYYIEAGVNKRNFTLLGDPALYLAYPKYDIITTAVNSNIISSVPDTLKALGKVTIKGEVRDRNGLKLNNFNGIIYPTVFDKAVKVHTLGNDPGSPITNFKLQKNIIYKGKASVKNGDFSFTFIVPKDIAFQYGSGRISYYGYNESVDANGYYENVIIGGTSSSTIADNNGPEIKLYLNDERFAFGGTTNESPRLLAFVNDSNGINTVGNGIGHDITAIMDDDNDKLVVLNDYYESDLDSYQSGKVIYPFSNLSEGRHNLRFKVWDVYNNSSETSTEFIVTSSAELALKHVLNYPNPFTSHTSFYFEHNRPCVPLTAQLQVFTISGKLVKTIEANMHTEGYLSDPIEWDGLDDYGDKIGRGVYIYRVSLRSTDGKSADQYQKLVILR